MAHITDKRLREMEEEMNRFEEEISGPTPPNHGPRIIRASGYSNMRAVTPLQPPPHPPSISRPPSMRPESSMPTLPPPPTPPSFAGGMAFMPPQLRHRLPGSAPNVGPPAGAPPTVAPAAPQPAAPAAPTPSSAPFVGPQIPPHLAAQGGFVPPPMNMGMPGSFPMPPAPFPIAPMPPFRPHIRPFVPTPTASAAPAKAAAPAAPVVVEQPKVVYMAAPVRNVPSVSAAVASNTASKNRDKVPTESIKVAPGIELNVPTRDIEAERAQATQMMSHPVDVATTSADGDKKDKKKKKYIRTAAGQTWEDATLAEWDPDDFRMFCGDLGNEVTDEILTRAFSKYPSFVKAKVVRDKRSKKTKGFGFASFRDPNDFVRCMREMNGKYVGNRPIKLRKSNWRDRQVEVVRKKEKEKKKLGLK